MIKQLIIHLGDCKTGSTSIQSALCKKAWQSKAAKILYPTNFNHNFLAGLIKNNNQDALKSRADKLRQNLVKSNAYYGIISAEGFEGVHPVDLSSFMQQYCPNGKTRPS